MDGFNVARSAISAAQTGLDVTANNIANVNTNGFKSSDAHLQTGPGGRGVNVGAISKDLRSGPISFTGGKLDLAIAGGGHFAIRQNSGKLAFTRDGSFQIDAKGRLVTPNGGILDPEITVPSDATGISVAKSGAVTAALKDGSTKALGQIQAVKFPNPAGLANDGNNLLVPTPASGAGQRVAGGEILQGGLEMSNTDLVKEMVGLIKNERMVQFNASVIRTEDEIQGAILDLKR